MAGRVETDELVEDLGAGFVAAEGMNGYRRVQTLRLFVDRIELGAAEILTMRLCRKHSATESQLGHGSVEFFGGLRGIVDRQVSNRFQPRRSFAVIRNKIVVRAAEREVVVGITGATN